MCPLPAVLYAPDSVVGDARLLLQLSQGEHPLTPQFLQPLHIIYTSDLAARVARFADGRVGYLEWACQRGYIHSVDDRYDHDIDELMA